MIKHIVMLNHKTGSGAYGVGDTKEEAQKIARKEFKAIGGGRAKETRHRTVEVADGRKLVVRPLCNGIEWWTEEVAPVQETAQ